MEEIKFLVSNGPRFPRHPRGLDLPRADRDAGLDGAKAGRGVGGEARSMSDPGVGRQEVEVTPPEWAGFARRNAELAARLVSPAGSTGRNDRDGL